MGGRWIMKTTWMKMMLIVMLKKNSVLRLPYLAVRGSSPGPLFTFSDGTYLTRQWFKAVLLATPKQAGLDDTKYNTYSFLIGAATSAKAAGISDMHIQILGRWKSSAYQTYIRTPTPVLRELSKQLVSTSKSPSVWDSYSNTCDRHSQRIIYGYCT